MVVNYIYITNIFTVQYDSELHLLRSDVLLYELFCHNYVLTSLLCTNIFITRAIFSLLCSIALVTQAISS